MTKTIAIMCAGKGTRMLPLTKEVPKPLININNKPFLEYLLNNVKEADYSHIILIVGHLKEKIQEFIHDKNLNVKIVEQKEIKGSGSAIKLLKEHIKEDFVVINGDNLFSVEDLKNIRKQESCTLLAKETKTPEKYGVLVVEDNKLIKIVEKPKEYVGNLINIGAYYFTQEIFSALDKIKLSERGEYEIVDAISLLAQEKKVDVLKIKDYWLDLGCIEDIPEVESFLIKKGL
jgi:UDP-N-acetylglucosamine diphosphorylase / glucose-1-phosphate thymidylyltransferase / UDP-N-acetylgalactosamine diphosphorylase / glucosamine-1-phosphate N-acetyltransferase / galactosamine-1-phosphate N-acetyltransferase